MTRAELLEQIYRFYPRGMYTDSPGYDDTEQRARQLDAARRARAAYPQWAAMIERLRTRYVVTDMSLHVSTGDFDSAYSGQIRSALPEPCKIGFHVSTLGPYYGVLGLGAPREEPEVQRLAQEIEATYGYERIPPEIGDVVVPDVAVDGVGMGKARIYDCLLSSYWGWSTQL
jgi:hypothetical protein